MLLMDNISHASLITRLIITTQNKVRETSYTDHCRLFRCGDSHHLQTNLRRRQCVDVRRACEQPSEQWRSPQRLRDKSCNISRMRVLPDQQLLAEVPRQSVVLLVSYSHHEMRNNASEGYRIDSDTPIIAPCLNDMAASRILQRELCTTL